MAASDKKRTTPPAYGTSPIKRARRTRAAILGLRDALYDIIADDAPMTVRQVFYQAVSQGLIEKTEAAYKTTVCRLLGVMRRDGQLPYGWLADGTRWQRKPTSYSSLQVMLADATRFYRRRLWDEQDCYVEVWLEKDALSGVLYTATAEWDVPLMVTRGYPSLSYLHSAAEAMKEIDKTTFIYYFGDHDPSGVDIPRRVEKDLRDFAPDVDLRFTRVAITAAQIEEYSLPTRPTKTTDSRTKSFEGESVEVDAIPPATLRELANECIVQHIDQDALERLRRVEAAERQTLCRIACSCGDEASGGADR